MTSDWIVWQVVDSAFPTGAFAHSAGLESAWHAGEAPDPDGVRWFLHEAIRQAGRGGLPLLNAAYAAPANLDAIDRVADAFLTNAVANRASRVQGRAFASSCARIWPVAALSSLANYARTGLGHYAPVTGAAGRALEFPRDVMQRLFLFQTARGVLAAAVRLGIIGSYEAQRLQIECAPVLDGTLEHGRDLGVADLTQTAPLLDVLQAAHGRLYSRLFQS